MPLALVYAGTPEFAVPALERLVAHGFHLKAVLTQPDRPAGRGRAFLASPVKRRALELGLPVLQPESLNDRAVADTLGALAADAFIVAAYGLLLPKQLLALPRLGCLNIHASLLPRWRGAAPVQRALLAGDRCSGVAIMRMEEGLDTGPVYSSRALEIAPRETATTLTARLAALGAELLIETLAALAAGSARAEPQPAEGATYARKLTKSDAVLDWRQSAALLERSVRAFQPWPVAETRLGGAQLRIHEAQIAEGRTEPPGTVVAAGANGIEVATGEGHLRLLRVQLAGRGIVDAAEFARRQPLLGRRFDSPP